MNATILPEKEKHYPVLLNEIVSIITPQYGGTFIDCTFGQGGYTKKILLLAIVKLRIRLKCIKNTVYCRKQRIGKVKNYLW